LLACSLSWWEGYNARVQFHAYIDRYAQSTPAERIWLDDHREPVLADGRAFCDWLEQFPEVPEVVPSGEADIGRFRMRYIEATSASTEVAVSDRGRNSVLAAAGRHFCDGTVESRTSFAVPEEQL
jgi:hypothetical protein